MVRYNRGKTFAKMYPVLCENGKVCKEYAKWKGAGTPPYARIFK